MSLEDEIHNLLVAVRGLTRLLELQQGIEAGELEMTGGPYKNGEQFEVVGTADESGMEAEWDEHLPRKPETQEPPPSETIEGMNEKTLALIALSDELGYRYLFHEGALAVDNRVLDEFNRRSLPDTLEP